MDSMDWHHVEAPAPAALPCSFADTLQGLGIERSFHALLEELTGGKVDYLADIDATDLEGRRDSEGAAIAKPVARGIVRKLQGAGAAKVVVSSATEHSSTSSCASMEDAVAEARESTQVAEVVAVCIDRSGSMGSPFSTDRTRMEAVKQMFYAFRDRTECLGRGKHRIGLIQFDSVVERMLEPTDQLDVFEAVVDRMEKRGSTAIFSALAEAADMLAPQFPDGCDLRILALTDGQNNAGLAPQEALDRVQAIGAVVDAIIVGDRPDSNLRKIVSATGGECFQIKDLGEGFELLEAEGVVSLRARRGGAEKPPFQRREVATDFTAIAEKSLTRGTAVHRAPTLAPTLSAAAVMDVAKVAAAPPPAASRGSGGAMKRTLMELKKVASEGAGEGIHVFPAGDNVFFWRVLLEGPPSTPFEGGVFSLTVEIPEDYPFKAPRILFETPIYHCNVNDSGKICLDILQGGWGPALSVAKALQAVRQLVKEPDTDNALRQWIAELTLAYRQHGDARYTDLATEHTRKDAAKTVADWRAQWGC